MDNTITTSTAATTNNYSNLIKHFEIDEHASFWGLKKPLRDGKIIFSFEEKEQNDFISDNTHHNNNEMNNNNNNNTSFEKENEIEIENGNEKNQKDEMTDGFDITALQKELKQEPRSDSFQSLMDRFNINEYSSNHSNSKASLLPSSPLFSFSYPSPSSSSPRLAQRTPRPSPLRSLTPRSSSTSSDFPSRKFSTKDQRPIRPRRASSNRKPFPRHPNQSRHYVSQNSYSSNNSYNKQMKAPITIQFANHHHHYPSAPLRSKQQQQHSFSRQRLPNSFGFQSRNKQLLIVPS